MSNVFLDSVHRFRDSEKPEKPYGFCMGFRKKSSKNMGFAPKKWVCAVDFERKWSIMEESFEAGISAFRGFSHIFHYGTRNSRIAIRLFRNAEVVGSIPTEGFGLNA